MAESKCGYYYVYGIFTVPPNSPRLKIIERSTLFFWADVIIFFLHFCSFAISVHARNFHISVFTPVTVTCKDKEGIVI